MTQEPQAGTWYCSKSGHDSHISASKPMPRRCHLCDSISFYAKAPREPAEPQDIPFYPDWLHRELPPEHRKTWCIAARLTDQHRANGYTLAITPKRNTEMQARHAEEVRAAVRLRLLETVRHALPHSATSTADRTAIVDAILADPAVAIMVDHHDRKRS